MVSYPKAWILGMTADPAGLTVVKHLVKYQLVPSTELKNLPMTKILTMENWPKSEVSLLVCLCWGLTSQSTIFQSCRDGATASWVINQYFRGVKCLAQGHNTAALGFEPLTSRSGVRHSTTEPLRSSWSKQTVKYRLWGYALVYSCWSHRGTSSYVISTC